MIVRPGSLMYPSGVKAIMIIIAIIAASSTIYLVVKVLLAVLLAALVWLLFIKSPFRLIKRQSCLSDIFNCSVMTDGINTNKCIQIPKISHISVST